MRDTVFNKFYASSFQHTGIKFGFLDPLTFLLRLSSPNTGDNTSSSVVYLYPSIFTVSPLELVFSHGLIPLRTTNLRLKHPLPNIDVVPLTCKFTPSLVSFPPNKSFTNLSFSRVTTAQESSFHAIPISSGYPIPGTSHHPDFWFHIRI